MTKYVVVIAVIPEDDTAGRGLRHATNMIEDVTDDCLVHDFESDKDFEDVVAAVRAVAS